MSAAEQGIVQSHTIIRVPDKAHAAQAPFVLLLVALDGGKRVLGHFNNPVPPAIGSRVVVGAVENGTMVFRALEETS
jgi:uncharacterized OB-fold protein